MYIIMNGFFGSRFNYKNIQDKIVQSDIFKIQLQLKVAAATIPILCMKDLILLRSFMVLLKHLSPIHFKRLKCTGLFLNKILFILTG